MPSWTIPVQVTPAVPTTVSNAVPIPAVDRGQHLTVTPVAGVPGTSVNIVGTGLPPHAAVQLTWHTESGSDVTAVGVRAVTLPLARVRTTASGTFRVRLTVPITLGGPPHGITTCVGSRVVGTAAFRVLPKVVSVTPNPAAAGTTVTVQVVGGAWTNYDNSYVGFGCAFYSNGVLTLRVPAAGPPGWHFIDLYPSVWVGAAKVPAIYDVPQLTYATDHAGDPLPAFHLVLRVVAPHA